MDQQSTRMLMFEHVLVLCTGRCAVPQTRASFCCSSKCAKLVIYCVYIKLFVWNSWCKLLSELSVFTSSRHCVHNSDF